MAGVEQLDVKPPAGLLLEITHRCPLHCLYCSNPLEMAKQEAELDTDEWLRVIDEAADLGVLQVHFSGGEPLLRRDLLTLLQRAAGRGMFTNLITSGIGLTRGLMAELAAAELGCFQLSLQGADPEMVREVAGGPFWKKKMEAARMAREAGISLTVNAVLHAKNLHQTGRLIDIAAEMGADEIELANTQYYGWALLNRDHLMPSRAQLEAASLEVEDRRRRYGERMEIIWVVPDYYDDFPKPCMGGWGDSLLSISPDGTVMPCLAANVIPDLDLPSVSDQSLRSIWYESTAFNAFRALEWMEEPCRSCPMRFQDYGGCRCQAFLLTGSATATDPVCIYSPHRDRVVQARKAADEARGGMAVYRDISGVPEA
jgi:pyrroloquinoline quinone biosynthesis protein E